MPPRAASGAGISLRAFVEARFDMPLDKLTWQCEQAERNYDPCISCATHAVKVRIERD